MAKKKKDVVKDISDKLSEAPVEEQKKENAPEAKNTQAFDLATLTPEQLQSLKAMLNATPDTITREKGNPIVTLRRIDDKFVMDFKNAHIALVEDPENNRKVERHFIPVLFQGEEEYVNVLYQTFIDAERVPCEVVQTHTNTKRIVEGQTRSRETGSIVEVVRTEVNNSFTVKLPDGETVEIQSKLANA
jgi:hypothetical protein